MKKRSIAFLLAVVLLLSCTGCMQLRLLVGDCGIARCKPAREQTYGLWVEREEDPEEYTQFQVLQHGETHFDEMDYWHYDPTEYNGLLSAMSDLAADGGSPMQFVRLNHRAVQEIARVSTLEEIVKIQYARDMYDDWAAQEVIYTQQMEISMRTDYWQTMNQVANSPLGYLIPREDSEEESEESSFGDTAEDLTELYTRESEKEQAYYSLIAREDYDGILSLFVELVEIRQEIARVAGYENYADYAYEEIYNRDYSTEDIQQIWTAAKDIFQPLSQSYIERLSSRDRFPWPYLDCSGETILQKVNEVLPRVFQEAYDAVLYMEEYGLYDIEPSESKRNSGYTTVLYSYNDPFLFNAGQGDYTDYTDVIHEIGHYVNYFYSESDLLYGSGGIDLAELQSQGMEIMFLPYYDEIFGYSYGDTMRALTVESLLQAIVDGALYDEFQYRVYSEQGITEERVQEIFLELFEEYGIEEYDGYENQWMAVEHTVVYPMYYISYTVSAISALELLEIGQERSWEEAAAIYRQLSAMNVEKVSFSRALELADLADIFSEASLREISESVNDYVR